jgi:hypothetical protein
MTLNDMAPAIGGALAAIVGWFYAVHIRNQARRDRHKSTPAE